MTQFSDSLFLGPVRTNLSSYTGDDLSSGDLGVGPLGTVYVYDTVPAALSTTSIRTASAQGAAGNATLNGTAVTGGVAQLYVAASSPYNQQSVTVSSTADLSGITFTVTGKDWRGRTVTEALTGPSNSTVETAKTFRTVTSVALSAGTAADTFSIGIGSLFSWSIEQTFDEVQETSTPNVMVNDDTNLVSQTGNRNGNYAFPCAYFRLTVNSSTDGSLVFTSIQAG